MKSMLLRAFTVLAALALGLWLCLMLGALLRYPIGRLVALYRWLRRARMERSTRASQDWWRARAQRHVMFTDGFRSTATSGSSAVIRFNIRDSPGVAARRKLQHHLLTSALVADEIRLRLAHYDNGGLIGNYTVERACCIVCYAQLPVLACFVADYYFCHDCLLTRLLPHYYAPRLLLLRAIPDWPCEDLVPVVAHRLLALSFDHAQIRDAPTIRACDCFVFDCRSKGEEARLNDLCDVLEVYHSDKLLE